MNQQRRQLTWGVVLQAVLFQRLLEITGGVAITTIAILLDPTRFLGGPADLGRAFGIAVVMWAVFSLASFYPVIASIFQIATMGRVPKPIWSSIGLAVLLGVSAVVVALAFGTKMGLFDWVVVLSLVGWTFIAGQLAEASALKEELNR